MELEEKFTKQLQANAAAAGLLGLAAPKRLLKAAEEYGAVQAMKEQIRRNRVSDNFDSLQKAGKLSLSAEALVAGSAFGPLFTDEEADFCLQALLEAGYYGI